MILIVADTGPINYLIQIGHVEVLPRLVEKIVLPASVQVELLREAAPAIVRTDGRGFCITASGMIRVIRAIRGSK